MSVVLGGLLFGVAPNHDDAVDAGFPARGQVRRCAMPDADSSLNGRGKLASEFPSYQCSCPRSAADVLNREGVGEG
jgi:hypothetical protein